MMRRLAYNWRRFVTEVLYGRLRCIVFMCGEERVGYSNFCREHTDEVLAGRWACTSEKR